jgi:hypothetical protein
MKMAGFDSRPSVSPAQGASNACYRLTKPILFFIFNGGESIAMMA